MRWPLHPPPDYLTLRFWVQNLAKAYGVSFVSFCTKALGIAARDHNARWFRDPSIDVLSRLSNGTGLSIDALFAMRAQAQIAQTFQELNRLAETEEGRRDLERLIGR